MYPIKGIAFAVWTPFTSRDYQRFGLDSFRDNFDVRVLDCTPWFSLPEALEGYTSSVAWFPGYIRIESYRHFRAVIKEQGIGQNWVIFSFLPPSIGQFLAIRYLHGRGCLLASVALGCIPAPVLSGFQWIKRAWRKRRRITLPRIISRILQRFLPPPQILVTAGSAHSDGGQKSNQFIIKTHSIDYEYQRMAANIPIKDLLPAVPYAVYLDDGWVSHPEYALLNVPKAISEKKFYDALDLFFCTLRAETGLETIVAAHPQVSYSTSAPPFRDRQIINGKTAQLVRDASLVIAHASTSISFAVIFKKPIILLTFDDFLKHESAGIMVAAFGKALQIEPINLDSSKNLRARIRHAMKLDFSAYAEYERLYIREPEVKVQSLWQPVISAFANLPEQKNGLGS